MHTRFRHKIILEDGNLVGMERIKSKVFYNNIRSRGLLLVIIKLGSQK